MLYNVTTMATTWHALAAQDVRLLQMQMDKVNALPSVYTFLNYLRCHDDIGWGLDFSTLRNWGMEEVSHKRFLNDFYQGKVYDSVSRGELYNDDPVTQDARFCGTTASMCGIEAALEQLSRYKENQVLSVAHGDTLNGDLASMPDEDEKVSTTAEKMERFEHEKQAIHMLETAIRKDLMLHAYMLIQSGIPMIYSGDEIGQLNDYSYKENPAKAEDSRYVHRGAFKWDLEKMKDQEGTAAHSIFHELKTLEDFRAQAPVFGRASKAATFETGDNGVLGIRRLSGNEELIGLFNFSGREITISMEDKGWFSNVTTGTRIDQKHIHLLPYGYVWAAKKINKKKEASL